MLHYYKHLFTSFLSAWFAQNGPEWVSAVTETPEVKQLPELSVKEILDTISADNKLDGNDKAAVDELKTRFESDKNSIEGNTESEKSQLTESMKTSLQETLSKGYTLQNENDYKVLQSMLQLTNFGVKIPENYSEIADLVGKEGERRDFSFIYKQGHNNIYVYDKFTQKEHGNDWTSDFGVIDVNSGEFKEQSWSMMQNNDINIDDSGSFIPNDRMGNNNEFHVDISEDNKPDSDKKPQEAVNYVEKIPEDQWEKQSDGSFDWMQDFSAQEEEFTVPYRAEETTSSTEAWDKQKNTVQENTKNTVETNELTKTQKLEASILSVKEKYPAVDIKIQDGKCNIAYENGYYTTSFTIDSPSNEKYLSKEGLLSLVEKKLDQWGGYKASNEAKKDSEDKSESDKDFTETVTDAIQDIKEGALETYDDVVAWLRDYFKNAPDAGTIDLGNGETLEVEYDDLNNKLYVDTQFFDGIYDYKSEIDLWDLSGKNPDELKELIASKNADFLQEYTDKVEAAEAEKMKKWMVDVLKGEKSRKTIDTLTINQEEMNVILFRDRKGDVKAKLSTPYGDGVSDSDLTIKLASIWDKISLNEIRNKIAQENFEKKYMELYKKNNPEKKAA